MTYLLLFILLLSNVICLLNRIKSKLVLLYSIITFTILLGGNNLNADYFGYLDNYRLSQTDSSHYGFDFLWNPFMKIGGLLNLTYNEFLICFAFIAYLVLFFFLYKRNDYNIHKIILFYTFYSFFIDAIQIANFFANVLAIIALYKAMDYKKCHRITDLIQFLILTICGLGLHSSVSILIPIIIFSNSFRKIKYVVAASIIFSIVDTIYSHALLDKLISPFPVADVYQHLKNYGAASKSGFGFLIYLSILLILVGIVRYNNINYILRIKKGLVPYRVQNLRRCGDVLLFLRFTLVMSPIFAISTIAYVRFYRIIMLYYGTFYPIIDCNKTRARVISNSLLVLILFYFFQTDVGAENFLDIMNNNIFFE